MRHDNDFSDRLTEAHQQLKTLRDEAKNVIEEANVTLSRLSAKMNAIRQETFAVVEPAARRAEALYDSRPWLWQDNKDGQAHRDWRDGLSGAQDILAAEIRLHIKEPRGFVPLDDMLDVIQDNIRNSPDD